MMGAQATDQGDCSKFRGNIPHSCEKKPAIVDLMPNTPYNQQIANCCTGGVMASMGKDPSAALSAFQISVGSAGNTNTTVKLPKNFTLVAPGGGYTCGPAKIIRPTRFVTNDGLRVTQAMMTWRVICTVLRLSKTNMLCLLFTMQVSSPLVLGVLVAAATVATEDTEWKGSKCAKGRAAINVHWHVKSNYNKYWSVKMTITNFNYRFNYTLIVQHPNLNKFPAFHTSLSCLTYQLMTQPCFMVESHILMQAGPKGNVHSLEKDGKTIALFPRSV
ncbi:hypothetical protein KY289_017898 [Solanum tuberosum]|nr:hypothetical protein KY289_017898 [Solanum tuberosum]